MINILFRTDLESLNRGLDKAQKKLDSTGKKMQQTGAGLTVGLTLPLAGLAAGAVAAAKEVNSGLNDSLENLKSKGNDAAVTLGNTLAPAVIKVADFAGELLDKFNNLDDGTQKIIIGVGLFAGAVGPAVAVVGTLSRGIAATIPLMKSLNVAFAANPIGLLVTGVGLLAGGLLLANSRLSGLTDAQKEFNDLSGQATAKVAKERAAFEKLIIVARDENAKKKDRLKAVKDLNALAPEYLGNLKLETINTDKAKDATKRYTDALLQKGKVLAAEEKLVEVQKQLLDLQLGTNDAVKPTLWQNFKSVILAGGNATLATANQLGYVAENAAEEKEQLTLLQGKLLEFINNNRSVVESLKPVVTGIKDVNDAIRQPASPSTAVEGAPTVGLQEVETINPFAGSADGIAEEMERIYPMFDEFNAKQLQTLEIAKIVGSGVGDAFADLGGSLVDSLGLADKGFQGFLKNMFKTVTKLISMLLANAVANAITSGSQSATASGPAAVFTLPAFIATAVAGVMSAFAAIPKFADGGIVYGKTLGVMGEYAGAKSNPEVIAPLNKLKELIAPQGGVEYVPYVPELTVKGSDLKLVLNRQNYRDSRLGG